MTSFDRARFLADTFFFSLNFDNWSQSYSKIKCGLVLPLPFPPLTLGKKFGLSRDLLLYIWKGKKEKVKERGREKELLDENRDSPLSELSFMDSGLIALSN